MVRIDLVTRHGRSTVAVLSWESVANTLWSLNRRLCVDCDSLGSRFEVSESYRKAAYDECARNV